MSVLEQNYNLACQKIAELVEEEKKEKDIIEAKYIVVQVAYNEKSFELYSATISPSDTPVIPDELKPTEYYNMVFVTAASEDPVARFKDKYLFKLAYAEVSFALSAAYWNALSSPAGSAVYDTSFYKPEIDDFKWAYKEVIKVSDLGLFGCWINRDREFKTVNIQADADFMTQYEKLLPAEKSTF